MHCAYWGDRGGGGGFNEQFMFNDPFLKEPVELFGP